MPIHAYDLCVNNFKCPDFHSCTLTDSLSACEEEIQRGAATLCKTVSTHFVNLMSYRCGKSSICYRATELTYPGPDKVMALFHYKGIEEAYHYVAENSLYLTVAGLGTFALGYLAYRTIDKLTRTPEILKKIEFSELPSLLERAEVSEDGDEICFAGKSETVSYRQVSNTIERLYSESVRFMRQKQDRYEGRDGLAELMLLIVMPLFILFLKGPPILNHYEEAQVRSAMKIRKRAYAQLNNLQVEGQGFIFETLTRIWDNTVGRVNSGFKTSVERDNKLLEEMVSRRRRNESIQGGLELASKEFAEGKNLSSRVIFASSAIVGIAKLGAHVALIAFYSCWVFSKTWGDTVSLVSKDAADDLNNLRTAVIGVFRPESVSATK